MFEPPGPMQADAWSGQWVINVRVIHCQVVDQQNGWYGPYLYATPGWLACACFVTQTRTCRPGVWNTVSPAAAGCPWTRTSVQRSTRAGRPARARCRAAAPSCPAGPRTRRSCAERKAPRASPATALSLLELILALHWTSQRYPIIPSEPFLCRRAPLKLPATQGLGHQLKLQSSAPYHHLQL